MQATPRHAARFLETWIVMPDRVVYAALVLWLAGLLTLVYPHVGASSRYRSGMDPSPPLRSAKSRAISLPTEITATPITMTSSDAT